MVTRGVGAPRRGRAERSLGWLAVHHGALEAKCTGLVAQQMATRSAPPSPLSLLGLLRHTWSSTGAAPSCCSRSSPNARRPTASRSRAAFASRQLTDPDGETRGPGPVSAAGRVGRHPGRRRRRCRRSRPRAAVGRCGCGC
ncbi:MAG: DUF664 domain-containing protein [Geodermatophilaceae bacterium]|nr:DUF664 domain-containing protein [Geodermatophilaceae bacterium]